MKSLCFVVYYLASEDNAGLNPLREEQRLMVIHIHQHPVPHQAVGLVREELLSSSNQLRVG